MKLMIASDIHGHSECCKKMFERFEEEKAEKLILLGDLLYHGPRNGVFSGYDPKVTIELLNKNAGNIITVRGNCDCDVDQMVLDFPILSDSAMIFADGFTMLAAHGHKSEFKPSKGGVLLNGHTHLFAAEKREGYFYINPGSVSIPKGGNPQTYMTFSHGIFTLKELSGTVLWDFSVR